MPHPIPPSPSAPKQRSGCLLALYIALGLLVLVVGTLALGGWLFLRSERGQKVVKGIRDGAALLEEATKAPGTEELRAAGCTQALVIPTTRVAELLGEFVPEAAKEIPSEIGSDTLVMCQLEGSTAKAPDCAELSRIYGAAAPEAPERFGMTVQQSGRNKRLCEGLYRRDGTRLGSLDDRQPAKPLEVEKKSPR